jgi:hypothetical protein
MRSFESAYPSPYRRRDEFADHHHAQDGRQNDGNLLPHELIDGGVEKDADATTHLAKFTSAQGNHILSF